MTVSYIEVARLTKEVEGVKEALLRIAEVLEWFKEAEEK